MLVPEDTYLATQPVLCFHSLVKWRQWLVWSQVSLEGLSHCPRVLLEAYKLAQVTLPHLTTIYHLVPFSGCAMAIENAEITHEGPPNPDNVLSNEKASNLMDEKPYSSKVDVESTEVSEIGDDHVLTDARDIATHVITVRDDPSANPWTFRSFFIGIGLSAFGGVLAEIYYFKPQTVLVSTMFLAIISYVVCKICSRRTVRADV
jgi:hypothetical protein